MKILMGVIMLANSAVSNAKDLIAVEWAPFVKAKGITDQQLIVAADRVNLEFLMRILLIPIAHSGFNRSPFFTFFLYPYF